MDAVPPLAVIVTVPIVSVPCNPTLVKFVRPDPYDLLCPYVLLSLLAVIVSAFAPTVSVPLLYAIV